MNENQPPSRLVPHALPTRQEMEDIPLNAEVVVIAWNGPVSPVDVGLLRWDEEGKRHNIDDQEDDGPYNCFMFHLPPTPDPEQIADSILSTFEDFKEVPIGSREVRTLLIEAAKRGAGLS